MFHDVVYIMGGIFVTLQYCFVSFLLGAFLGLLFGGLKYSCKCVWPINAFVSLFRGTPLILQLSFVYFVLPEIIGFNISALTAGVIAFGLNSAAYMTEIIWAGLKALPKGQFEAAYSLHIPKHLMWKDIIIPQVLSKMLPAIANEITTLLKETALISTIGGIDIMRRAQYVAAEQFTYFAPLCIAGLTYYMMVQLLTLLFNYIDRKLQHA